MKKHIAFIALGGNQGNRQGFLRRAIRRMQGRGDIRATAFSKVYETSPVGPRQRDFLNAAMKIETALSPKELLIRLQQTERALGRRKSKAASAKWGPRPIDLDILFYDRRQIKSRDLTIPHPRYRERKFVLKPLADIAPSFRPPGARATVARLLARLGSRLTDGGQKVKLIPHNLP